MVITFTSQPPWGHHSQPLLTTISIVPKHCGCEEFGHLGIKSYSHLSLYSCKLHFGTQIFACKHSQIYRCLHRHVYAALRSYAFNVVKTDSLITLSD